MQDIKISYGNMNESQDIKYNIALVEKKIGAILPKEYKEFICKYNGGCPELNIYRPINSVDDNDERVVSHFYNYGDNISETENIFWALNMIKIPGLNKYCLIGSDPFGNVIVMNLDNKSYGSILFADHEDGYSTKVVANSFNDFIDMLYISDDMI